MVTDTITVKQNRFTNIELLRILSMILIIAHHYFVNSSLLIDSSILEPGFSYKTLYLLNFGAWGKMGINCFMLITGYFMCTSNITLKKYLKLLGQIYFYRIIIFFIFCIIKEQTFTIKSFIKLLIPFKSIHANFTGAFLVFYLFIPFLNILIKNLNKSQHLLLISLSVFVYCIFDSIPMFYINFNYVSWFIVLYFIASFIRLYPEHFNQKPIIWLSLTLLSFAIAISIITIRYIKQPDIKNFSWFYEYSIESNKILSLTTALCLFQFFKNIKIPYSKTINTIAASTFGVLLIHGNSDTMRNFLWNKLFKVSYYFDTEYLILHSIVTVLIIFIVCDIIDIVRIKTIEKPYLKLVDLVINKIKEYSEKKNPRNE